MILSFFHFPPSAHYNQAPDFKKSASSAIQIAYILIELNLAMLFKLKEGFV